MSQLKKYKRVKYLGKGSYGAAILVELRSDPSKKFVIKEIVIGHLKPAEQASAKSEADVLHQMSHSNITSYVESFVENSKLYIVMEHADGGDLSSAIAKRKSEGKFFAEDEVMRMFVQICLAMKHVHSANILHRDLKSQNIFLTLNGMVKLGDFGIAKVLDASEDQARTQIGTPYYLSPEICESKPYGRKSDVWSLGVVLYEILALEMPFQAQSLPALVLKICSGEPNYKPLESRYSSNLLTLTRAMLNKNPDKRPSVSQVVKTEFIMNNISRLLSYTLKMGNGGVPPPELPSSNDIDVVERNIEAARQKQKDYERMKEQEAKQAEKAAKRQEDIEKIRRYKQEQLAKNKEREREAGFNVDIEESKDNRSRTRSPMSNRPKSPMANRPKSPTPIRATSPKRGASPVRSGSPVGPAGRRMQSERSNNNLNVEVPSVRQAPRVQPRQEVDPRQQARGGNGNSPMSLAEVQAQKQRSDANVMRNNINANVAVNNNNRNNVYEDRNNAMVVQSNRGEQFESAARREYFANRAAAQAAKARVEKDLHGGERLNIISGQPMPSRQASQQPQIIGRHERRNSEGDRDNYQYNNNGGAVGSRSVYEDYVDPEARIAAIKAQKEKDRERELALKEMQLKQALEEHREDSRHIKANKEKRQAIAFDIDLSSDEPVNRPIPVLNSNFKRNNKEESKETSPIPESGSTKSKVSVNSNRSKEEQKSEYNSDFEPEDVNYDNVSVSNNNRQSEINGNKQPTSATNAAKVKKGWGPPVDPNEIQIAKGVAMYDADKAIASNMFDVPSRRKSQESASNSVDIEVSKLSIDGLEGDDEPMNDVEVKKFLANKRASQLDQRQQAKGLLKKLREKKEVDAEIKKRKVVRGPNDAKEVHIMVASPSRAESKAVAGGVPMKSRMADIMKSVEAANESVQSAVAGNVNIKHFSPVRGHSHSEDKTESKSSAIDSSSVVNNSIDGVAGDKSKRRPSQADKDSKQYDDDVKSVALLGDHYDVIESEDDDLQDTLRTLLDKQKVGVTVRRKGPVHNMAVMTPDLCEDTDIIPDEEGLVGYDTANFVQKSEDIEVEEEEDVSPPVSTGAGRGVYLGNDVEVVGMQCMLAKALMGEGDSDDDSDFDEYVRSHS